MPDIRPRATAMLEHALAAAKRGFRVFPVRENSKVPCLPDWPNRATTDPNQIREWWTDAVGEPLPLNVGIAVDHTFSVLDFDIKNSKKGMLSYQAMRRAGLPASLTIATPTGGVHTYLKTDVSFPNHAEKLADYPGVDTRGLGGFVLAPGSTLLIDGKEVPYTIVADEPIAPAPQWIVDVVRGSAKGSTTKDEIGEPAGSTEAQREYALSLGKKYLLNSAPEAIEGAGGDDTTLKVAMKLRDFGVPQPDALDLMLDHWNDTKASPPWSYDDLERKVANAYRYAKANPGHLSAAIEFEPVHIELDADHLAKDIDPDDPFPAFTNFSPIDPRSLPKRVFVFDGVIAKKTLAALNAPSGVGKTQFTVQLAISAATGRNIAGLKPATRRPQTVAYWNNEDEADELRRRMLATAIHFGIDQHKLTDHIRFASGVSRKLIIAGKDKSGVVRATKHADKLIHLLRDMRADMLVLDPLVEFHSCDENSNVEMAAVAGVLRQIAVEADVAVLMLHHDRKPDSASSQGFAGSQHAMRGASSLQGVTRAILTLYSMAEKDAATWGVPEDQRHLYLRLDQAKNNLGLVGGEPLWFRRTSVALQDEIGGDVVGVLDPVEMAKVQKAEKLKPHEAQVSTVLADMEGAGLLWTAWPLVEAELLANGYRSEASWRRWLAEIAAGERALEGIEMKGIGSAEALVKREIFIRKKGADFLD